MFVNWLGQQRFIPKLNADNGANNGGSQTGGNDGGDNGNNSGGQQTGQQQGESQQQTGNAQGLTLDAVQKWLSESEEGKKWLQSQKDAHFSKGLETWQKNNLSKLIDEEINKRYPPETEEQKQLRELKQQFEQEKQLRIRQELKTSALSYATEKGLPTALVDFFIGEDHEKTMENMAAFEKVFHASVQAAVEAKFKENGRTPAGGGQKGTTLTMEAINNMSESEINARWNEIQEFLKNNR